MREVGILQPLVVRPTPGGFELIAGERRLRAAKEAGLERVPVLIRQAGENESMELALVENLQRENLSPLETAAAYQALMDGFGLYQRPARAQAGQEQGRCHQHPAPGAPAGADTSPPGRRKALRRTRPRPARPGNEEQMVRLAQRVVDEKLSVRKTEELVREMLGDPGETPSATTRRDSANPDEFHRASRLMREALELPVRVKGLKSGGKVEIRFRQTEELEALVSLLTAQDDN